jgi:hypothetical protein
MSEPWSDSTSDLEPISGKGALPMPTQAALWLIHMNRRGNELIDEYQARREELAAAKKKATLTEAEWFLKQESQPMDMRKWVARQAAADDVFQMDVAEEKVDVARERIWLLKSQMENVRSILATVKEELRNLPGQPG